MTEIYYIDRLTKRSLREKVYGQFVIETLYGSGWRRRLFSFLRPIIAHLSWLAKLYAAIQRSRWSRYKIDRFIRDFEVDPSEFLERPESFRCFNDFFIRRLKPEARPIAKRKEVAVMPADGRYLFYSRIDEADGFWVKGEKFSVEELLVGALPADNYVKGSMVIARLCPVDYHRFHFPVSCVPKRAVAIAGPLFSVNPLALKYNIRILSTNKRMVTELHTESWGQIAYVEVGATYVGSIHQTYTPDVPCAKGAEKGYFSFGGSCLILLFEPGKIVFDADLLQLSSSGREVRCLMGQSMGSLQLS